MRLAWHDRHAAHRLIEQMLLQRELHLRMRAAATWLLHLPRACRQMRSVEANVHTANEYQRMLQVLTQETRRSHTYQQDGHTIHDTRRTTTQRIVMPVRPSLFRRGRAGLAACRSSHLRQR